MASCIWQSLFSRWACRRSTIRGYSGKCLPDVPYSAVPLVRQWIHIYVSLQWPSTRLSPEEYENIGIFLELTSGSVPGSSLCLVRQRIHLCQSTASCRLRSTRKLAFFWETTSGSVSSSSLCLVRQRIHLRQSTFLSPEEYEKIGIFLGDDFRKCFRFLVMLGSTADTFASVYVLVA